MTRIEAIAPTNIALVKYWGKRDQEVNLPITSSLSVTLSSMFSKTSLVVHPSGHTNKDRWSIFGDPSKSQQVLSLARDWSQDNSFLDITIENNFPSGAGLASSASSIASLGRALFCLWRDKGLMMSMVQSWCRQGSGSSVRSFHPGFVLWDAGKEQDGSDCTTRQIASKSDFPLDVLVCCVDSAPKAIGSTKAMELSRQYSPSYNNFHHRNQEYLQRARSAIEMQDFLALASVCEENCLDMHKVIEEAGVQYFQPMTRKLIQEVQTLRSQGRGCFFTIDAGPNVKVFCLPEETSQIKRALGEIFPVSKIRSDTIATKLPEVEIVHG